MMVNYSSLRAFTGLATAARKLCQLTVNKAMVKAVSPAKTNIHQLMVVRYAKPSSHFPMAYHEMGTAMANAKATHLIKSLLKSARIWAIEAPFTLRIPISL